MAVLTYSGSYSGTDGLNAVRVVQLSASGQIANYRVDSLTAHIFLSTTAYGKTYSVTVQARNSNGVAIASGTASVKLNSSNYTGAWIDIGLSAYDGFNPNAIASMAISDGTENARTIFLKANTMQLNVGYTQFSWCTAPTVVSAPASAAPGGSAVISWSGAQPGANMYIAAYNVYRSTVSDGSSYTYIGTAYSESFTDTGLPTNVTLYYYVQTVGSVGGYNSGVSAASNGMSVYYGTCTAPTTVNAPALSTPAAGVMLTWSGAAAGQNVSIAGYNIYRSDAIDGTYVLIGTSQGQSYTDTSVTGGHMYYYKVQTAANVAGYNSPLSNPTQGTKVNALPAAPSIRTGGTIYNSRPRILVTAGTDADGDPLTVGAAGYTASTSPAASGGNVILRKATETSGMQDVTVSNTDPNAGTASASVSFTVSVLAWTDDPIVAGTTQIKAAHMNEIRTALDNVCDYYGINRTAWAEPIIAGQTPDINWPAHVAEIRQTIQRIVDFVNSWDTESTTHRIILPAMKTALRPSAEIMNQLREIITLL